MRTAAELSLLFVALYPICTAALWIAGGILGRSIDEESSARDPDSGWPGVTVVISAYNEERVIATSVSAVLAAEYPQLELLVLDDGSSDRTAEVARSAGAGDPRLVVLRDPTNRGKADRLNEAFRRARHDLVVVTDADAHVHPDALKLLVARMLRSPLVAAVGGEPYVTNRGSFLGAMQVLESASIIGLIRRTQSLTGRMSVVAGVLGLFDRRRVLAVGGYDPRMATEDIDLTWRLLVAGWHTANEPRALVGMQAPSTLGALWKQRTRWARGQGEVMHLLWRDVLRWRGRRLWFLAFEAVASLFWIVLLTASIVLAVLAVASGRSSGLFGFGVAWGIAIAIVATMQLAVAVWIRSPYDPRALLALLLGPIYPLWFWLVSAAAALHSELGALVTGPREERVVWNIGREPV